MRLKDLVSLLFVTIILAGCQVKKGAGTGGLISDHASTTNKFTLQTLSARTYISGETLSLTISFPFSVDVVGSPRLNLNIGSQTKYANYVSGAGSRNLNFSYTIVPLDDDSDGVDVVALELNGASLTFIKGMTSTPCDISSIANIPLTTTLVDNTPPTMSSFLYLTPGFLNPGEVLTFRVTYSDTVVVTGSPTISVGLASGTITPTYSSGSGSSSLIFTHTVTNSDIDTNGFNSIGANIALPGGATIKDPAGNNAPLALVGTAAVVTASSNPLTAVYFNGNLPYVVDVTIPPNGNYIAAQDLNFSVRFNTNVTVSGGTPYLPLTIGSNPRQAQLISGEGTNTLNFRYTTIPGDIDADGIQVTGSLTANGALIRNAGLFNFFTVAANNIFTVPSTTGVVISSIQPQPTSVARNADITYPVWGTTTTLDNYWIIGQTLLITVGFNSAVNVNQTSGTPSIPITIGATPRSATYLSGSGQSSLIFRYVIQENDLDTDGSLALGSLELNGGVIADSSGTNTLLNLPTATLATTYVDGVKPTIASIGLPTSQTYSTTTGVNHTNMTFPMVWSEAVNISTTAVDSAYINLTIGATTVRAQWSTTTLNNRTTFSFNPTTLATYNDSDGIALNSPIDGTAVISDLVGNTAVKTFTSPGPTTIYVDTVRPTISSITPVNGTYVLNDDIEFTVVFSEPVTTNKDAGYPRIQMMLNVGGTVFLEPLTSSRSNTHTFKYTVVNGNFDNNGVSLDNDILVTATGYLRDDGRNTVANNFVVPSTPLVLVDALGPDIVSVTPPLNGTYVDGDVLDFTVTYNENVEVTGAGTLSIAAPSLTNPSLAFNYVGGTGTTTLTFRYTVTATDFDFDGLGSVSTIGASGITLSDISGNTADMTFPSAASLAGVNFRYSQMKVWSMHTNSFANEIAIGPSMTQAGSASTTTCGTKTCRVFSGDDSVSLSGTANSINTVFIVLKTPTSLVDQFLLDGELEFLIDGGAFDINATSDILVDAGAAATRDFIFTNRSDTDLASNGFRIIQMNLDSNTNFNPGTLIPTSFTGAVAEIIMFDQLITAPQRSNLNSYLNTKYRP